MADTRISVIIAGRALCRKRNEASGFLTLEGLLWQADARHILKLRIIKKFKNVDVWSGEYEIPRQTLIYFDTTDLVSEKHLPNPNIGPFTTIMDLDALHRPEEPRVSLTIFSSPPPPDRPVTAYFSIPHIKDESDEYLYANKLSKYSYQTWKRTIEPGPPPFPIKKLVREAIVGDELGTDFLVPPGKKLSIRLDLLDTVTMPPPPPLPPPTPPPAPLTPPFSIPFDFPHEDDVRYEIRLDNACVAKCDIDDFFLYYRIVDGSKVEIEQIGPRDRFKDPEAPCNPTLGDPTCDFVRYARSGGLNC